MCAVSMIGEHYSDKYRQQWPEIYQPGWAPTFTGPTREEFDKLRADVDEMLVLLRRAKLYDAANHEPDCETDEKMAVLRKVAKLVGVDLDKELRP